MCKPEKSKIRLLTSLRILAIFTALWSLMFVTDSVQNIMDRAPIFTVMVDEGRESRHSTYVGLFYVVYVYEDPISCPIMEDPTCGGETYSHVEMHAWWYNGN